MLEGLIEKVIKEVIKDASFTNGSDCLSFNQIGRYVEDTCSEDELSGILDHLAGCLYCSRLEIKMRKLLEKEKETEIGVE